MYNIKKINIPLPVDYRTLNYNKKVDLLAKLFITRCTSDNLFSYNKINPKYYAVRKFFDKQDLMWINTAYDFVYQLSDNYEKEEKFLVDMYNFFKLVEKNRIEQIMKAEKEKTNKLNIEQYKEYSLDMLNDL